MKLLLTILVFILLKIWELLRFFIIKPIVYIGKQIKRFAIYCWKNKKDIAEWTVVVVLVSIYIVFMYFLVWKYLILPINDHNLSWIDIVDYMLCMLLVIFISTISFFLFTLIYYVIKEYYKDVFSYFKNIFTENWNKANKITGRVK